MVNVLILDLFGKGLAGDKRHAQEVVNDLDIKYKFAIPQSMFDSWFFVGVDDGIKIDYHWLSVKKVDPQRLVGNGLSQEEADSL